MNAKYYTLITGASEGFGKALALECARRKMNTILVALPGPELTNLANFIKRNYSVDAIAIEKDLCKEEDCIELFEEVSASKIGVNMLINNVGLGSTLLFSEGSIQLYEKQVKLNVLATTILTRLFLETLKKNSPANILNVGSLSCFFSLAKKQVYGATKSYIYSFSKSLRCDLKDKAVNVSVICPGGMYTNLSNILLLKSSGWLARQSAMNPEEVATIAIDGLLKKKEVIIPGTINKILLVLNYLIPAFLKNIIIDRQMRTLTSNPEKLIRPFTPPTLSDALSNHSINNTIMKTNFKTATQRAFLPEVAKSLLQFLLLLLPLIVIAFSVQDTDPGTSYSLMLFSGWLCWTFIEYFNHRFRMHSNGDHSKIIGYASHMSHHHHPTDIEITAIQRVLLFAGNIALLVLCFLYKNWIILFTGLYTGFVIYTLMHWFLHQKLSSKIFPGVHEFHIHHHCKHPDKCFGVTVTWWDHLFDTIPHQQKEVTEKIKTFYYKK